MPEFKNIKKLLAIQNNKNIYSININSNDLQTEHAIDRFLTIKINSLLSGHNKDLQDIIKSFNISNSKELDILIPLFINFITVNSFHMFITFLPAQTNYLTKYKKYCFADNQKHTEINTYENNSENSHPIDLKYTKNEFMFNEFFEFQISLGISKRLFIDNFLSISKDNYTLDELNVLELLYDNLHDYIIMEGIKLVRKITKSNPLVFLTTGRESIDLSLFSEDDIKTIYPNNVDNEIDNTLINLHHLIYISPSEIENLQQTPKGKLMLNFNRKSIESVSPKIDEIIKSDDYLKTYVSKHSKVYSHQHPLETLIMTNNTEINGFGIENNTKLPCNLVLPINDENTFSVINNNILLSLLDSNTIVNSL